MAHHKTIPFFGNQEPSALRTSFGKSRLPIPGSAG